jgi:hypothetical protein
MRCSRWNSLWRPAGLPSATHISGAQFWRSRWEGARKFPEMRQVDVEVIRPDYAIVFSSFSMPIRGIKPRSPCSKRTRNSPSGRPANGELVDNAGAMVRLAVLERRHEAAALYPLTLKPLRRATSYARL